MKITQLEILPVPFQGRMYVYVKLHTDEGIVGIGEAACSGKEGALIGALRDAEQCLIGENPFQIERIWQLIYRTAFWRGGPVLIGALSGIEHALWDIKGKALNVPVYELIGGMYRHRVKVYCWIGGDTPETWASAAAQRIEAGWGGLKFTPFDPTGPAFSLAHGKSVEAKVKAVREAIGDEVPIAIDGHGRLNPVNAMEMAKRIEPYGILFFEEPVLPESVDAMAEVRRNAGVPIATGERLFTRYPFREYLVKGAVDVVQPDICTCGGIMEAFKIAAMADTFFATIAPHNPLSPLSTVICLHLDTVVPNFLIQEVPDGNNPDRHNLIDGFEEKPVDGHLKVPQGPGWGVSLNEEYIRSLDERPSRGRPGSFDVDGSILDL
ncbi:MAG: galactonate dehydratase [Candidatus Poribacteria bacterium]|nr:galactonate dehydratase [Candidatus Poribacteria bacterium]